MGTNNLTAVFVGGEYKVAQYGQWDGYPSGQGMKVLSFLRRADLKEFERKCKAVSWISKEERQATLDKCGVRGMAPYTDMQRWGKVYPHLHRDTGAKVLQLIADSPDAIKLSNHINFAGALFCEWAYVVDLDKETFEAFKGFNTEPLGSHERFKDFPRESDSEYYPIRLLRSWPLSQLPADEEFLSLEGGDEE